MKPLIWFALQITLLSDSNTCDSQRLFALKPINATDVGPSNFNIVYWPVPEEACDAAYAFRTISGRCNNVERPSLGAAMGNFRRILSPVYQDKVSAPRQLGASGSPLPSARLVSTALHGTTEAGDDRHSHLLMQWGQFLDHDLSFTPETRRSINASYARQLGSAECSECPSRYRRRPSHCFPIPVPKGDPVFPPDTCLKFVRSAPSMLRRGPREQMNLLTAFIDASNVYGSDENTAKDLRKYEGGQLKVSRDGSLPFDRSAADCKPRAVRQGHSCFKAGDMRVNEQPGLMATHALWLSQHNRLAGLLAGLNPDWDDERLYQEARRIVGAQHQHITFAEWLPRILGHKLARQLADVPLDEASGKCDASIFNEFATAAFRFGHTLVGNLLQRRDNTSLRLEDHFMDPSPISGPHSLKRSSQILLGLASQPTQSFDQFIARAMRDRLFAESPRHPGMDIVALNIQRGRDHGLPPYNAYRSHFGLKPVKTWAQLEEVVGAKSARRYRKVYESPEDIDLFSGMISEPSLKGGLVGELCGRLLVEQFTQLKRCDRFFYETAEQAGSLTAAQLAYVRSTSLGGVVCASEGRSLERGSAFDWQQGLRCGPPLVRSEELEAWRQEPKRSAALKHTFHESSARSAGRSMPEATCGQTYSFSFRYAGEQISVRSPNFPDPHPSSCTVRWLFHVESDRMLTVRFPVFHLESGYDRLRIFDLDRQLADCSGYGCREVRIRSPVVRIVFASDSDTNSEGFRAVIRSADEDKDDVETRKTSQSTSRPHRSTTAAREVTSTLLRTTTTTTAATARRTERATTTAATTPVRALLAPFAAPGGVRIRTRMRRQKLEDGADFLNIYDGSTKTPDRMRVMCTGYSSCPPFDSSGSSIMITLTTDATNQGRGFLLEVSALEGPDEPPVGVGECDGPGMRRRREGSSFSLCEAKSARPKICYCWAGKTFKVGSKACVF